MPRSLLAHAACMAAVFLVGCTTAYTVDARDLAHARTLSAPTQTGAALEDVAFGEVIADSLIFMPAKTAAGQVDYVRRSAMESITPVVNQQASASSTDVRTPLVVTGLSVIAAGLITFAGFYIDGKAQADATGIGKYASDGATIGSALFGLSVLLGGPVALSGLFFDDPTADGPVPATWPSMKPAGDRQSPEERERPAP